MTDQALQRQPRHLQPTVLPTLDELAATANLEHEACEAILEPALRGALSHAITAGEALLSARAQIPTGHWREWLRENFRGSYAAAGRYIRITTYRHLIQESNGVKDALEILNGLPAATPMAGVEKRFTDETREQAMRDLDSGATLEEVAAMYGCSLTTVYRWRNPNKNLEHRRRWYARRREQTKALAELERQRKIKAAVRKAGAALSEAYSSAHRMGGVIEQAESEASSSETRTALQSAGEHYRKMLDEIIRALGVQT